MAGITSTETRDVWRLFWHSVRLDPTAKRLSRGISNEIDPPYRHAQPLVVRVWRGKGFAIGWWRGARFGRAERDEFTAIKAGLTWDNHGGHDLDIDPLLDVWAEETADLG